MGARRHRAPAPPPLSGVAAVLWDLDGTLTDSVAFVVDTANAVIAARWLDSRRSAR